MNVPRNRCLQLTTLVTVGLFTVGLVFAPLGAWTGAVIGAWFVSTQKLWRGFLWLTGVGIVSILTWVWKEPQTARLEYLTWATIAVLLSILPFFMYRLTVRNHASLLATLSLPLWGTASQIFGQMWLPAAVFTHYSLVRAQSSDAPLMMFAGTFGPGLIPFSIYWSAATINWMWKHEIREDRIAGGASIFAAFCIVLSVDGLFHQMDLHHVPYELHKSGFFAWTSLGGGLLLTSWTLLHSDKHRNSWEDRTETVEILQSPFTGEKLQTICHRARTELASKSGERFPICNGIPVFTKPDEIAGLNLKYNRLYQTIGDFYDDSQRIGLALMGIDREQMFLSYLRLLEISHGDFVLETSVGTGLNFKFLPHGIKLFGLDLSAQMLENCQANLIRWHIDAELFLGNAEELPFTDGSFDVVFHVGGINFFNNRAKAISEMIRVAKPGSLILITDEMEKYVEGAYERNPVTSGYFKNRPTVVTVPIDLVPSEMEEVKLQTLWDGKFYALTFRKPNTSRDLTVSGRRPE